MIGSQKQIEWTETTTCSVKGYHNVCMILVLSSQRFPLLILVSDGNVFSVISNVPLYVSTFARHCPTLPKVFSVLVHSYDKSTLLSISLYVSMFLRHKSCLLSVYPYISAILVVSFTFLRNLLSHRNSSVCPFGVLPYDTHVVME